MINPITLLNPSKSLVGETLGQIETERDYHNSKAVGNSDLKLLERSPRHFVENKLKRVEEENPYEDLSKHMKMGTMVEQSILEPDRFEQNFIEQEEMETPSSPNQDKFVELILTGDYGMVEAHEASYANSNASKAADLYEKLKDYINFTRESQNKGTYDQDEKETLLRVCGDIMAHDRASDLLLNDSKWDKAFSQLPMVASIEDVLCKGLADRVIVDTSEERITLIDLKVTSKNLNDFGYWCVRRKYHWQLAHYSRLLVIKGVREWGMTSPSVVPIIITSRKEEPYGTTIRKVPSNLMLKAAGDLNILLNRFRWHAENEKWDRPKSYYTHQEGEYKEIQYDEADVPNVRF